MREFYLLDLPVPDAIALRDVLYAQKFKALHQQADRQQAFQCPDCLIEIQHGLAQRMAGEVSSAVSSVASSNGGTSRI